MSFVYPRRISVKRPKTDNTVGDAGYNAERRPTDFDDVAANLPASIQFDRQGQRNPVGLATDARALPTWNIFIPKASAALGLIKQADVVIDDQGRWYQVFGAYWNSLGYQLKTIGLEM